jgi:transposase
VCWYRKALRSGIGPLQHFAKKLRPDLAGILAHCRYPLGTNLIEGTNNKIKVTASATTPNFFLKIRAAFPGNG